MGRHATGDDPPAPAQTPTLPAAGLDRLFRSLLIMISGVNVTAAVALAVNRPGASAGLLFIASYAPLPAWAAGFGTAAAGLLASVISPRCAVPAHILAAFLWLMLALGATFGLAVGSTTSPSGSILLAGLTVAVAAYHVRGLLFRRAVQRAARRGGGRGGASPERAQRP